MKKPLLTLAFILLIIIAKAQVISGLYAASLVNDSTGVVQRYELALTEYRGKIWGYSYTTFIRNDSLFYSIKKVQGNRRDGELVVEDIKMLHNNFPEAAAKGVRQINSIPLNGEDTLRAANGTWKTTRTKIYYALSGESEIRRTYDSSALALITHLQELQLLQTPGNTTAGSKTTGKKTPATVPAEPPRLASHERAVVNISTFKTASDSLIFSFYDNGVIDGDSISVYVNGQPVINATRLTDRAVKHILHLNNSTREYNIVLVAESLGSIPPNTGLLIIQDGDKRYQLNFSADFRTNASVVIHR